MKTDMILADYLNMRRSTPAFQMCEPGPDTAQIRDMLRLAVRVPDHGKIAPWRFVVYQGAKCAEIGEALLAMALTRKPDLSDEMIAVERARFTRAPVVIAVISTTGPHPKVPEWEQVLSAGAVCLNLLMAANSKGFVSNWLTEWFAYDEEAFDILGIHRGEKVAGFIHIGSTTFPIVERPRPDLDQIVSWIG